MKKITLTFLLTLSLLVSAWSYAQQLDPDAFVTVWETTGVETITIPTTGTGYNYTVDWGDGLIDTNLTGDATHTYISAGEHIVQITGSFPRIFFDFGGSRLNILEVRQWGAVQWTNMFAAFRGCTNLNVTASDAPDLSNVTVLTSMFESCSSLTGTDSDFSTWDTSNATDMSAMFRSATQFNGTIGNWSTANVEFMSTMFDKASSFNQDLFWNTGNVRDMTAMFAEATNFNGDLSGWNTANLQSMSNMFRLATGFAGGDLSNWNTANVTSMGNTFLDATNFNGNITTWNLSNVTSTAGMFWGASSFNQDIGDWNVSNVNDMESMFRDATSFDQDLGDWDISELRNNGRRRSAADMFDGATLSTVNYVSLLIGWSTLDAGETQIPADVVFSAGNSTYCGGADERQSLLDDFGWTITDGGQSCVGGTVPATRGLTQQQAETALQNAGYLLGEVAYVIIDELNPGNPVDPGEVVLSNPRAGSAISQGITIDLEVYVGPALETSVSLSSGSLSIIDINGSTSDDDIVLSNDGTFLIIDNLTPGVTVSGGAELLDFDTARVPLADITSALVVSLGGGTDLVTLTNDLDLGSAGFTLVQGLETFVQNGAINANIVFFDIQNALDLGDITVAGALANIGTDNSSITQQDGTAISVINGALNISAGTGDITLSNPNNDVLRMQVPSADTFAFTDANTLELFNSITVNELNLVAGGDITLLGTLTLNGSQTNHTISATNATFSGSGTAAILNLNDPTPIIDGTILSFESTAVVDLSGMAFNGAAGTALNVGTSELTVGDGDSFGSITTLNSFNVADGATLLTRAFITIGDTDNPARFTGKDATLSPGIVRPANGTIAPGPAAGGTGTLTVSVLRGSASQAALEIEVNSASDHDLLVVTGSEVRIGGSELILLGGYDNSSSTDEIIILDSQGPNAISGTFSGLAEGAPIRIGAFNGTITYVGGTGNDIALIGTPIDPTTTFITTWQTDNPGTSDDNTITVPTVSGETYDYRIDWGDGSVENITTDTPPSHTYATAGEVTVTISGTFPRIFFDASGDNQKITNVVQWGAIEWSSMVRAFAGATNLDVTASDAPDLSNVTDLTVMFGGCTSLVGTSAFNTWDVSNVNTMTSMFSSTDSFNQNLNGWDTSSVIDMSFMFQASEGINRDFVTTTGGWNTSNVEDMTSMFSGAINFNGDISSWVTGSVTDMDFMFEGTPFNQDISTWNTGNVTNMRGMFQNASDFNGDISGWNVSSVTDMNTMFRGATSFDQNLGAWDISELGNSQFGGAGSMFEGVTLSIDNYDALLLGWSTLDAGETQIPSDINFNGGDSRYCLGEAARETLINDFDWSISDGGIGCSGETFVLLENGTLMVTDINGGVSDDTISLSSDGTTLTISGLTPDVSVLGGPVATDATTVTVALVDITTSLVINFEGGTDALILSNALDLGNASFEVNAVETFTQLGDLTANDITINTPTSINLGNLTASGNITVTTDNGAITQKDDTTITANILNLDAGTADITLNNTDSSGPGTPRPVNNATQLIAIADILTYSDRNALDLGDITVNQMELITRGRIDLEGGTVSINGSGTSSIATGSNSFAGTGAINLNAGILNLSGIQSIDLTSITFTGVSGTTLNVDGASITASDGDSFGTLITFNSLELEENASITAFEGIFIDEGSNTGFLVAINAQIIGAVNLGVAAITSNLSGDEVPGILSVGDLNFGDSSSYEAGINGTVPGTDHNQLVVNGTVTIGAAVDLDLSGGFDNSGGTNDVILIDNDGNDPIVGTFDGLPQGAAVSIGNTPDQFNGFIDYFGGDGNDVALVGEQPNLAPTFTSLATASVEENQTTAIDVEATDDTDAEGSGLTFALTGTIDDDLFAIDTDTGEISFNNAPDFEVPGDADGDNAYEIQVTVTDSEDVTTVQDITITVTDVDDDPEQPSLIVTTTLDMVDDFDGLTSLREAITHVNDGTFASGSTISFDPSLSGETIFLDESTPNTDIDQLVITTSLTINGDINGDGTADITISADSALGADDADGRVFLVENTANTDTILFNGLIVRDGGGVGIGAGIWVSSTAGLTVSNSQFLENSSSNGAIFTSSPVLIVNSSFVNNVSLGFGGVVFNTNTNASVTIINSTMSGNTVTGGGSGGGAVFSGGTTTIVNSTLSGNSTTGDNSPGGAVYSFGETFIINSTISGNFVTGANSNAGGIYTNNQLTLTNSIVLGNASTVDSAIEVVETTNNGGDGTPTFNGLNIVGTGAETDASDGVINADPALVFATTVPNSGENSVLAGLLADNGGGTQTIALAVEFLNPALDTGDDDAVLGVSLSEATLGVDINGDGDNADTIDSMDDFASDQRGSSFDRNIDQTAISGETIDLGAVELQEQVPAPNQAPVITSLTTADAAENQTFAIDVEATDDSDAEGSGLLFTFSGGADNGLFNIDASTGEVTFVNAPDFENPGSDDGDNDFEIQVTVTDTEGLTAVQDITISVTNLDDEDPVVVCPADITVDNDAGECGAVVDFTLPTATDDGPSVNVISNPLPGSFFDVGTTTVTVTALDDSGASSQCTFTVTVNDNEAPVLTCAADISQGSTAGQPLVLTITPPSVTDNCDDNLVVSGVATLPDGSTFDLDDTASDETFPLGTTTIVWSAVDTQGIPGTCTQTVTVTNSGPQQVSVPDVVGQEQTTAESTIVAASLQVGTVTSENSDTVDAGLVISQDPVGNATVDEGSLVNLVISLGPANAAPIAGDDSFTIDEDVVLNVAAAALLQNDSDADDDAIFISEIGQPTNGTAEIVGDNLVYTPNADFNGVDTFTYTLSDGNGGTDTATVSVTVNPINDAPIAVDDAETIDESESVTISLVSNDIDVDGDDLTIASADTTGDIGGIVTIQPDEETITFEPNGEFEYLALNETVQVTFEYTVTDGNLTDTAIVTLMIEGENDAPEFPGAASTLTRSESVFNSGVNVSVGELTDLDVSDEVTGSVTAVTQSGDGAGTLTDQELIDAAALVVNAGGSTTLIPAGETTSSLMVFRFNFASANNPTLYDFLGDGDVLEVEYTFTATDSQGATDTFLYTIRILGENDVPSITSSDVASVEENQTSAIDVNATDPEGDTEGNGLTFALTGGNPDNNLFTIDSDTGIVSFNIVPDFENPTSVDDDNDYEIQVTVTDSGGLTDVQDITITVTDVDEVLPMVFFDPATDVSLNEGDAGTTVFTFTVRRSGDLTAASEVSYLIENIGVTNPADSDDIQGIIPIAGTLNFAADAEVQTITVVVTGDTELEEDEEFTVELTSSGIVNAVLGNDSQVSGIILNDDAPLVNEAPVITSLASADAEENQTFAIDVEATDDSDTEGSGLLFSITGGEDINLFSIDSNTGEVTFDINPDFENPSSGDDDNDYEIEVTVTDSEGLSDSQDIVITVLNVDDENSVLTCPGDIIVPNDAGECGAIVEYTVAVIDDGLGVDLTLSPESGSFFAVGTTTVTATALDFSGAVSQCTFTVTVTDSEGPELSCSANIVQNSPFGQDLVLSITPPTVVDNCDDNPVASGVATLPDGSTFALDETAQDYTFPVGTTSILWTSVDAVGNPGTCVQTVNVSFIPSNTGPQIISSATADVFENQTDAIDVEATDDNDSEGNGLVFSITDGVDSNLFSIDANTGKVTFDIIPDFENPSSGDDDNDYEIEVTVTDSEGLTDKQDIVITVTDENEDVCTVEIDVQPQDTEVCAGESASFSAQASGNGALTFDWQFFNSDINSFVSFNNTVNGSEILDLTNVQVTELQGVDIRLVVTSDNGTPNTTDDDCQVISNPVGLNINPVPAVSFVALTDIVADAGVQAGLSEGSPAEGTEVGDIGFYDGPGIIDGGDGTYSFDPAVAGVGTHTITYTYTDGKGCSASASDEVVVLPATTLSITGFYLINADTDSRIMELTDGMVLVDSSLPTANLSIEAEATDDVGSVLMELTGAQDQTMTENFVPYSLFGDITGDFFANLFPLGEYTVTASPYSEDALGGTLGISASIDFSIVAAPVDVDGDGFFNDVDCNDNDDSVYPGAPEICDGKDNNCDGLVDDEDPSLICDDPVQVEIDLIEATYLQGSKNPQPFGPLLRVEENNRETYLKFDLSDFSGDVTEAVLEMQVASDPGNGTLQVFLGSNSNWTEGGLNGNNNPVAVGAALASLTGTHAIGQTKVWNLDPSRIVSGEELTLIVKHSNGNDVAFASDETVNAPKLILTTGNATPRDNDGDGFFNDVDCDDNDNTVYPGAPEICDGKDNNCDGLVDGEEPGISCDAPVEVDADLLEATYLQGSNNPQPLGPLLRVEEGNRETYLKFDLSNFDQILEARLEMEVTSDPGNGTIEVFLGSDSDWTETGLRGFNSPGIVGGALATITGTHSVGQTKVWNLDFSRLPGGKELTLIVKHGNGNDVAFASDETVNPPRLVVTVNNSGKTNLNELVISPNPARVDTHIMLKSPSGNKLSKGLSVFDIQGRLVLTVSEQEANGKGDFTLNVNDLKNGTYFIKAYDENGVPYVKQMVIVR